MQKLGDNQIPEYINPNNYVVHLTGPDGESVQMQKHTKKMLSEYFERYVSRGFIKRITPEAAQQTTTKPIQARLQVSKSVVQRRIQPQSPPSPLSPQVPTNRRQEILKARKLAVTARTANHKSKVVTKNVRGLVGKTVNINPNELLKTNLAENNYPISNNIGVGILSYNRASCLRRLVESIIKTTDLRRTTVFISDDASTDPDTCRYLDELSANHNIIVIRNITRLGIAGNSNRLLRCLARFEYGILLNDDVEILDQGWEYFYPDAIQKTGFHHFMYRQPGVYGAERGEAITKNEIDLEKVVERPHGAVLAFSHHMFRTVGYFDESYGLYGMEHVDWSQRAWELGLQEHGFFDVAGAGRFFSLHTDVSAVQSKGKLLTAARKTFSERTPSYIAPTVASQVPGVSYIIPFRNFERSGSISTVVNNIRAQRFPSIEIIMVEQDEATHINLADHQPVTHFLTSDPSQSLFNKSKAFNFAASKATTDFLILHDADMLAQGHYTSAIMNILKDHESCHIGNTVIYTNQQAMEEINRTGLVSENTKCDRVVGYYEGGSLACRTKAYWLVGGFNEDYKGYGCFLPGNYVLTDSGYKLIEQVTVSDRLYTHECEFQPIELRQRRYVGQVIDLYIPGRLPIKGVTPNHPFLVKTGDDEFMWRRADELKKNDIIASTDFVPKLVQSYDLSDLNSLLAKTIKAVAGRFNATQKTLSPAFINTLNDRELSAILGGGCDGDANHGNGSENRLVYHTSSINLAMTYSGIMRRLGIAHSFGKRKGGSFPGSSEFGFDLCVNREFEHLISTLYDKPTYSSSNSIGKSKFGVVYDIKYRDYDGPVYNFEVEEDHSYVVNGMIVHNCEDCDFYARLSGGSKWKEDRVFDFLHLWHSRVPGWNTHHNENKAIENDLKQKSVAVRIQMQYAQLNRLGYGIHVADALKSS